MWFKKWKEKRRARKAGREAIEKALDFFRKYID